MFYVILWGLLLLICIRLLIYNLVLLMGIVYRRCKKREYQKMVLRLIKGGFLFIGGIVMTICLTMVTQTTANTPSIVNKHNQVIEGSIAELKEVNLNGRKEWISIRGESTHNPVLLFLAGGPGGSQMAATRYELSELEKHFIVVGWDQPGSGKSYKAIKKSDLTIQTYIDDGHALTKYLKEKFSEEKIYIVGESWGSALGIFLAKEYPKDYHAVIGTGQMVDFLETEKLDYEKALEIAEIRQDTQKIEKLKSNGYPPYYDSDMVWKSAEYLNYLSSYMTKNSQIHNGGYNTMRDIFSIEYGIIDKVNYLRGIVTTFNHVYPQLYDIDLRVTHAELKVPVYFFLGRHDINAPIQLVEDYERILKAPYKEIVWFEHSGHSPWINESQQFVEELLKIKDHD